MAIIIVLCVVVFVGFFVVLKLKSNNNFLVKTFDSGNVIVSGRKRKGKDLLFSHTIALRKKDHYSNINYDIGCKKYNTDIIALSVLNCGDNDYINLITNNIKKFDPFLEQKKDTYISDAGIYLPSHFDSQLSKYFKGLPITYALSGHLYESNIHCNSQRLNRVWIKLREQADHFILVKKNIKLGFGFLVVCYYYDREESALKELLPFSKKLFSTDLRKVEFEKYKCANGVVKKFTVFIPKKHAKRYDTHALRKDFFVDPTIFDKK